MSRVPAITALFWIVKICTTGMGEAFSDYLNFGLRIGHAELLIGGALVLAGALAVQFTKKKYVPWAYWSVVVVISIYGTILADVIGDILGVPFFVSAFAYVALLTITLLLWHRVEGSLSIHSVFTWRREAFYWATVLFTFALGTAVGDMTADTFQWGFLASGFFFVVAILIPAIGYRFFKFNEVFAFWFAYILTRPLGASFADWLSQSKKRGGVGFGANWISLILTLIIVALVGVMTARQKESRRMGLAASD
jgi:uncharacterized membrane-anchored protein